MTERLAPNARGFSQAVKFLRNGQLVAFPTETVYGLGADALNNTAVAEIYQAKGRPSFNPLIVHVSDLKTAQIYGEFSAQALEMVGDNWPAGLTLVVPLKPNSGLSSLITAGGESVALRRPQSTIATNLLQQFDGPIAAPSANPSGGISPTTADHVFAGLAGKISAVVDGGAARSGVESTILDFTDGDPVVLREGAFVVPERMARQTRVSEKNIKAPGQLTSHYAPKAVVRLNATEKRQDEYLIGFGEIVGDATLSKSGDLVEAAAKLFALLHQADALGVTRLAIAPIPNHGLGCAINDRIQRAAAPR